MATHSTSEITKVDFKNKGKEDFTVEYDAVTSTLTLKENGFIRNKIKIKNAESVFDRMLKLCKKYFLKLRERYADN